MDSDESSAKKFKSSSLDEVLEIFSTFSVPPVQTNVTVKEEPAESDTERYAHIMVKETLVEEEDLLERDKNSGIRALVGNSFIDQEQRIVNNVSDHGPDSPGRRAQVLDELDVLGKLVRSKFLEKEKEYKQLELRYDELKSKSVNDEEFENEVKAVLKLKQDRILELESELEVYQQGSSEYNQFSSQNRELKVELEKKNNEVKVMEERINHVKELVSVSAEKIKTVKQKEDHFRNIELENIRLQNLLSELKSESTELVNKVDILTEEVRERDGRILILKETNANLEQEVNIAMDTSDKSVDEDDIDSQLGIKKRDQEISILQEKIKSLSDENKKNWKVELEAVLKQRDEEITVLRKEKQVGENKLSRKYESILIEKDKELFNLKERSLVGSSNDKMKTEFKLYFDELERKSQNLMGLIKDQQNEISILRQQRMPAPPAKPVLIPPTTGSGPRHSRPPASQATYQAKPRLGNVSDLQKVRSPSPAPYTPRPLPDLVSGVSQYDLAPSYFSGHGQQPHSTYPPGYPSRYSQPTLPTLPNLPVPGEALLERSLPVDLPQEMPVLQGPFSFD